MWVAAHHFRINLFDDVGDIEASSFSGELRVKYDLQEQVAQLIGKLTRVAALERVGGQVGSAAVGPPAGPAGHDVPYDWQDAPWT